MRQGNLQISRPPINERPTVRAASSRAASLQEEDESLVLTVLQRRWKLLLLTTIISLGIGAFAYQTQTMPKSVTTGQLVYKALPPSDATSTIKHTPLTIKELMLSNESITELRKRHDFGNMPIKDIRDKFNIKASRFVDIIDIEFTWNDGQVGIDVVNDMMDIVGEMVTRDRKQTLESWRTHAEQGIREIEIRIENEQKVRSQLREQMNAVMNQNGTESTNEALLLGRITQLDKDLQAKLRESSRTEKQIDSLNLIAQTIEQQLRQEVVEARKQQLDERMKIVRTASPRMVRLQQQLEAFVEKNQNISYISFKSKLDETVGRLLSPVPPSASLAELERTLATKLAQIERMELEQQGLPDEINGLQIDLTEARRELANFSGSEIYSMVHLEDVQRRLDEFHTEKTELASERDVYRRLQESKFRELTPLTKASWATSDLYSGRKKVFALAFAASMMMFSLPIFAFEHFFPSGDASDHLSKSTGVPIVGKGSFVTEYLRSDKIKRHPSNQESLRLLALRIQQSVQGPGALVLFSGLNHDQTAIPTMTFLAECLSRREERVLIIDACDSKRLQRGRGDLGSLPPTAALTHVRAGTEANANGSAKMTRRERARAAKAAKLAEAANKNGSANGSTNGRSLTKSDKAPNALPAGLSDFFKREEMEPSQVICSTEIPGVDIIPSGSEAFPEEIFCSRRLDDLLDQCRQDYTLILVSGPSTNQPSDLQMLSARAEGILFTAPKNAKKRGRGEEVISELIDMGAPVIGIVG